MSIKRTKLALGIGALIVRRFNALEVVDPIEANALSEPPSIKE
jgi:hypothetical protein